MLQTYDVGSVRSFAHGIAADVAGCNGEGMYCEGLDTRLKCLAEVSVRLWQEIGRWSAEVFAGRAAFDPEVEAVFKEQVAAILNEARPLVRHSKGMQFDCADLAYLPWVEGYVLRFDNALKNWVSPRRSVGPAARVRIPEAADAAIRATMAVLRSRAPFNG